ncbi:WxL protein host-binding domain-containing protein [Enterococcus songbeiensis]|uniref:WxL protein host-binding domain-containing protein n=1 Tax=Enterococcus songbeiensis TaxID=2559927 RepID=UPI0010F80BD1|nr:DUF3324 domain-containing protein [Enterococcus songbeiensis]
MPNLTVTPLTLDQQNISGKIQLRANSKKHKLSFSVTNFSTQPMQVQISGASAATNEEGKLFYQMGGHTAFGTAPFLTEELIPTHSLNLPASGSQTIDLDLTMPTTDFSGQVMGAVAISVKEETTFVPLIFQGSVMTEKQPIELSGVTGSVVSDMPAISVEIGNPNTALLSPVSMDLTLTHKQFFGLRKTTYLLRQQAISFAPNQVMTPIISLQGKPLLAGSYRVTGTMTVDGKVQTIDQSLILDKKTAEKINQQAGNVQRDYVGWLLLAVAVLLLLIGLVLYSLKKQTTKNKKRTLGGN